MNEHKTASLQFSHRNHNASKLPPRPRFRLLPHVSIYLFEDATFCYRFDPVNNESCKDVMNMIVFKCGSRNFARAPVPGVTGEWKTFNVCF